MKRATPRLQRGSSSVDAVLALLALAACWYLWDSLAGNGGAEKAQRVLREVRVEEAGFKAQLDRAEQLPPFPSRPGLWVCRVSGPWYSSRSLEIALLLDPAGSFTETVMIRAAGKELASATSAGKYEVKGRTWRMNVNRGVPGLFSDTGRVLVNRVGADELQLSFDDGKPCDFTRSQSRKESLGKGGPS